MKHLRIAWRFTFFVFYTAWIVLLIYLRKLVLSADLRDAMRIRRRWARNLLAGVGVEIRSFGEVPAEPCLLVCNHRSYLDPIILLAYIDALPVAKAEMASWPLLGKGAQMAGILYLKRESANSRANTLKALTQAVRDGYPIILFPEGTTSGLPTGVLPFKKGAFRAAAEQQIPLSPVAFCFAETADFWIGSESFLQHAYRRFKQDKIRVDVHFGPVYRGNESAGLLEQSRHWIESRLTENPPQ
ncbi:MAG: 1-acyl-sn-glycerol-3-phosphate acyltransferase [Saprospiraceae bacterium]|nr:1-acyl-sn-glycerol-3-phosphate acyltransferase [Saprospiraceae bacterium]